MSVKNDRQLLKIAENHTAGWPKWKRKSLMERVEKTERKTGQYRGPTNG